jgi:ABC-type hemin transport system ATPase subunit
VPDGAHDGDKAGKDCPRHALVVKAPQVFQRAAAASDDETSLLTRVRQLNGAHNLARRIVTLHGGRVDDDGQGRVATLEDVQNIVQCRTGF